MVTLSNIRPSLNIRTGVTTVTWNADCDVPEGGVNFEASMFVEKVNNLCTTNSFQIGPGLQQGCPNSSQKYTVCNTNGQPCPLVRKVLAILDASYNKDD